MNTFNRNLAYEMDALERERILRSRFTPDPEVVRPTKCKVRQAFCIGGRRVEPGTTVTLDAFTARSLEATGKVELL